MPRKNARPLAGKPLVEWSIEACRVADCFTSVVVTTDDDEIADIALRAGASVVRRTEELCGDGRLEPVVTHAANAVGTIAHESCVLVKQPTSPFVTPDTLRHMHSIAAKGARAVGVERNTRAYFAGEVFDWWEPAFTRVPTQKINFATEAGGVWAGPVEQWRDAMAQPVYLTHPETVDIDTPEDWAEAERIARGMRRAALPWGEVQTLVLDCDGVLTDNRVTYQPGSERVLTFHRGDGMGITAVKRLGVDVHVVSGSDDVMMHVRCRNLDIEHHGGTVDKRAWLADMDFGANVCFVGNDANDVDAMRAALIAVAPADAHPSALAVADHVTTARGGHGAVREVCDMICAAKGAA